MKELSTKKKVSKGLVKSNSSKKGGFLYKPNKFDTQISQIIPDSFCKTE